MDAYLSREAYESLRALKLISSRSTSEGFLLGHKRGPRFFVEKIFLSMPGFFPSLQKYQELDQLFDGKLLGFFSFNPDENKVKKILAPYTCGKLLLKIKLNKQKKMTIQSYVIDYENEFFLFPIKIKSQKQGNVK